MSGLLATPKRTRRSSDAPVERATRNGPVLVRAGGPSGFDEFEKVWAEDVRVGSQHAVWEARVCLQHTVREQVDRAGHRTGERDDLVVFAMHDQYRHSDLLQIFSVVLQPGGYGLVVGLGAAGHALAPPVCDYRLRRLGARTVESIERTLRDCPVKFRPVAKHACPNRVEPLPRL